MEHFQKYFILILSALLSTYSVQGQNNNDRETITQLYDLLQTRGTTSNDAAMLTPKIKWQETRSIKPVNKRNNIPFYGIMKDEWQSLHFQNLNFREIGSNEILVTGSVSGKKLTDCEFVTSKFEHTWSIKEGEIIGFSE